MPFPRGKTPWPAIAGRKLKAAGRLEERAAVLRREAADLERQAEAEAQEPSEVVS